MRVFYQLSYIVEATQEELQGERKEREGEDDDGESDSGHVFSRETLTLSCVGVGYSNFGKRNCVIHESILLLLNFPVSQCRASLCSQFLKSVKHNFCSVLLLM